LVRRQIALFVFSNHLTRVPGDIAVYSQIEEPTPRRIEHLNVAGNHGHAVGRTIAGKGESFAKVPVFWSAHALQFSRKHHNYAHSVLAVGVGHGYDDIKLDGSPADLKVRSFHAFGGGGS
jgi:apoptosis-inducing factor 3